MEDVNIYIDKRVVRILWGKVNKNVNVMLVTGASVWPSCQTWNKETIGI